MTYVKAYLLALIRLLLITGSLALISFYLLNINIWPMSLYFAITAALAGPIGVIIDRK